MALLSAKCPYCGALLMLDTSAETGTCPYCDSVFTTKSAFGDQPIPAGVSAAKQAPANAAPIPAAGGSLYIGRTAVTAQQMAEIEKLIKNGQKLMAIKAVRELSRSGLAEAKQFVDDFHKIDKTKPQ